MGFSVLFSHSFLGIREHEPNLGRFRWAYQPRYIQFSFPLGCFLGQDVTRMRMASLDFPGSRKTKPFLGPFMCFQFWHFHSPLQIIKLFDNSSPVTSWGQK